ncbi:MAG: hypothetical protein WCQ32_03285 [bacterium]
MKKVCFALILALSISSVFAQERSMWQKLAQDKDVRCPSSVTVFSRNHKDSCEIVVDCTVSGTFNLATQILDSFGIPKNRIFTYLYKNNISKRMIAFNMYFPTGVTIQYMNYEKVEYFIGKVREAVDAGLKNERAFMYAVLCLYVTR